MESPEHKIVVLGGGGVGKSALTIRLVNGKFLEEYDPTIEDSYRRSLEIDGKTAMLDILDTAGQDDFAALRDAWVREGEAFLVVYSITKRATFEEAQKLLQRIHRIKEDEAVHIVLAGNKCDLDDQRQVQVEEGKSLAQEWEVPFFETSAKTEVNHVEVFMECVRCIRKASGQQQSIVNDKPASGCCCIL